MTDRNFLIWIHERLEHIHGENTSADHMHRLRALIRGTAHGNDTGNLGSENWPVGMQQLPAAGMNALFDRIEAAGVYDAALPPNTLDSIHEEEAKLIYSSLPDAEERARLRHEYLENLKLLATHPEHATVSQRTEALHLTINADVAGQNI